jgi:hypothetical protein
LLRLLFTSYRRRAVLGANLMITQSFLYNAIFFTYTLVLTRFYHVSETLAPVYLIPFAVGNLAGPLTIGRKPMISAAYIGSGAMLAVAAWLFDTGVLTAVTQTIAWCVIFFFASAGASAGYLTVSEIFPLEVRAEAIAVFFAIAQCFGAVGPILYGALIGSGNDAFRLFIGYLIGGGVMIIGGVTELLLDVPAQQKSLEAVAQQRDMARVVGVSPVEAVTGSGDRVGVLGPAPVIQHGPDVGCVVGLHGKDARGGVEVGLVADQRGGTLEGGEADVLEEEGAAQEVVLIGVHVEGLAGLDQARGQGRVGETLTGIDGWPGHCGRSQRRTEERHMLVFVAISAPNWRIDLLWNPTSRPPSTGPRRPVPWVMSSGSPSPCTA